jgi:quercetin dioxygenase-like cupin family protein
MTGHMDAAAEAIESSDTFRRHFSPHLPFGTPHPAAAEFARLAVHAAAVPTEASSNGHDRFEDERGVITDLLGQVDAVTEISTLAGKIRGNHVHERTTQWTYIVSGRMTFAWTEDDGVHTAVYPAGALVIEPAGIPHAWRAEEDTRVLVFTKGPRSGQAYETDTTRLDVPLLP